MTPPPILDGPIHGWREPLPCYRAEPTQARGVHPGRRQTQRDHRASSRVRSRPAAIAVADPSAHEEMTQIKEATPSQKGIDAQGRVSVQWPHAKGGTLWLKPSVASTIFM